MPTFALQDDLNWTVSHRDLFFAGNDGTPVKWDERVAVVRDDNGKCLGSVSPAYETVQNSDLLKLIDPLVSEGLLTVENKGYLNHGAKVFAQAKIAQEFRVVGEDYNVFITLLNGHVGNSTVAIGPTATRVICGNTFAMAYTDLGEKYRHSAGVTERVLESKTVIEFVNGAMKTYADKVERLDLTTCSEGQFQKAVEKIFEKDAKNIRNYERLNDLFYNGAGNMGKTMYDAFNAVTDFTSNVARKSSSSRFNYVNFGTGSRLNQRAMAVLSNLVTV